jgi:uncharacterized protein YutE (UPF0331/DUF86 family)
MMIKEDDFLYWNEEQTMQFLNYTKTSMKKLRNSKAISKYQIGHRYFYDPKEIMQIVESSKVYGQSLQDFENYIEKLNKYVDEKELSSLERKFVNKNAIFFLTEIYNMIPEHYNLNDRDKSILQRCLSTNSNIKKISEEYSITPSRVTQIFERGLRVIRNISLRMKKDYDDNFESVKQENLLLKKQIEELKYLCKKMNIYYDYQTCSDSGIDILTIDINDIDMSFRLYSVLKTQRITTIGDIMLYKKSDCLKFRNFGAKSILELENILKRYGLELT